MSPHLAPVLRPSRIAELLVTPSPWLKLLLPLLRKVKGYGQQYPTATKYSDARMTRREPQSYNLERYVRYIVPTTLGYRGV
jgi:hypothetical protein